MEQVTPKKELQVLPEENGDSNAFQAGTKSLMKPHGASGTELFAGYFSEEYLQKLRGKYGAKVYDEMRRSEAIIAMLLNAVTNPIKAAVWELEAANADSVADAEKHKELIEYCLKEMIDFETFLHEVLTFLIYGYSLFEAIDVVVFNHAKFGTFNGLKAIAFRSQKTIERWNVDRVTGELAEVEQWIIGDLAKTDNRSSTVRMPADFLLCFTLHKEGDNYEGISALRPMYGPYFRKNLYLKIAAIGVEKNAIGTIKGVVPAGKEKTEEFQQFKNILANFAAHETAYITVPEGWEVEVVENKFDAAAVKEMLVFENTEMINSIVANFLALGMSGGSGSFALGTDLSDFFLTGIQNYANLVAGVINRKLIPSLIKKNFGPQAAYPKLKATNINDKAGKELAEILGQLSGKVIKPDDKLEDFIRKSYNLPKADPASAREPVVPPVIDPKTGLPVPQLAPGKAPIPGAKDSKVVEDDAVEIEDEELEEEVVEELEEEVVEEKETPKELSERRLQLAEDYKKNWDKDKEQVKALMQNGLRQMLDMLKVEVAKKYKNASAAQRLRIGMELEAKTKFYSELIREELARLANNSLIGARKETRKAKNVKLAEAIQLAAPKGGYFDALPLNIRRIVKAQSDLLVQTQAADLVKVVAFQYSSSATSTDNIDQIVKDIEDAAGPILEGSTARGLSVDAAAGNAVSTITNQARLEWFFEPEVLETIESFTFVNEDPVSDVCKELDGTTWNVGDPDLDRYTPPLHHNCKSRLVPNEKGVKDNPEARRNGTPISDKALKAITLHECECNYHLSLGTKN